MLDAMDASQRLAFESHLEDCDVCATEAKELQATAALLGEAAAAVPPPELRRRVLSEIDAIRQDAPVVPLRRPAPVRRAYRQPVFAAAAAVLAFAVLTLGGLYTQARSQLDRYEAVLSAPDLLIDDLAVRIGGSAQFRWSDQRNLGVLIGDGLQPAPQGQTYALWLIDGERHARYAGSFTPDGQGRVVAVVSGDINTAETLGVTPEDPGAVASPTGPLVMSTTLG